MKKIIHVVSIHAEPNKVFKAVSTAEGLSNWWSTEVKSEEKVGGIVGFKFTGDFNPNMKITSLNEPTEIGWKCVSGHDKWQDNLFSFKLTDKNEETELKFVQEYANDIGETDYGVYNFNWGYYLHSLKEYCETGKGSPFSLN